MKKVDWNRRNEKSKITKFKKYGDENFSNPEKRKSTNLVRFGNEVAMNSDKLRDEIRNKNILKYGSEHFFSSEVGKEKVRQSLNNKTVDEKKAISEKRRQTCLKKYGTNYVVESEYFKKLSKQTCLSNGYKNGGCSPEAMKKIHKKYYYDGRNFDSKPEIAFYIFLKDNNIDFEFHPDKSFEYFYDGKSYLYFPDFKVGNEFVEIKGVQFFENKNPNGKMINIYGDKSDGKFEAKHQCMIQNKVRIITDFDCYFEHVELNYGKNFLNKFKRK